MPFQLGQIGAWKVHWGDIENEYAWFCHATYYSNLKDILRDGFMAQWDIGDGTRAPAKKLGSYFGYLMFGQKF